MECAELTEPEEQPQYDDDVDYDDDELDPGQPDRTTARSPSAWMGFRLASVAKESKAGTAKMTQDALEKFFSATITHLSQSKPQTASSPSPFPRLVREEGFRSLPSGGPSPLSADVSTDRDR